MNTPHFFVTLGAPGMRIETGLTAIATEGGR